MSPLRALRRLRALPGRIGRLESRVRLLSRDLDCDVDGSIAQAFADLHSDVCDLRARIAEWETGMTDAESRKEST